MAKNKPVKPLPPLTSEQAVKVYHLLRSVEILLKFTRDITDDKGKESLEDMMASLLRHTLIELGPTADVKIETPHDGGS